MNTDSNSSIIFGLYCDEENHKLFLDFCKEMKIHTRELRLIDVEIPLNERYDDVINGFKHFIMFDYWNERNPFNHKGMVIKMIKEQIEKATGYKIINPNYSQNDVSNPLLGSLAIPLLFQQIPIDNKIIGLNNIEINNMERLKTFESTGYKRKEDIFAKCEVVNTTDTEQKSNIFGVDKQINKKNN